MTGCTFTSINLPTEDAGQFIFRSRSYNLTVSNTASTQVLGKRKECDGCEFDAGELRKRYRCGGKNLDRLMVCQWTIITKHLSHFTIVFLV